MKRCVNLHTISPPSDDTLSALSARCGALMSFYLFACLPSSLSLKSEEASRTRHTELRSQYSCGPWGFGKYDRENGQVKTGRRKADAAVALAPIDTARPASSSFPPRSVSLLGAARGGGHGRGGGGEAVDELAPLLHVLLGRPAERNFLLGEVLCVCVSVGGWVGERQLGDDVAASSSIACVCRGHTHACRQARVRTLKTFLMPFSTLCSATSKDMSLTLAAVLK